MYVRYIYPLILKAIEQANILLKHVEIKIFHEIDTTFFEILNSKKIKVDSCKNKYAIGYFQNGSGTLTYFIGPFGLVKKNVIYLENICLDDLINYLLAISMNEFSNPITELSTRLNDALKLVEELNDQNKKLELKISMLEDQISLYPESEFILKFVNEHFDNLKK